MASDNSPEAEFRDPRRIELLNELERRIGLTVPPTVWACLWLSDIEKLEELVERANHTRPLSIRFEFDGIEESSKLVKHCAFYHPHMFT